MCERLDRLRERLSELLDRVCLRGLTCLQDTDLLPELLEPKVLGPLPEGARDEEQPSGAEG